MIVRIFQTYLRRDVTSVVQKRLSVISDARTADSWGTLNAIARVLSLVSGSDSHPDDRKSPIVHQISRDSLLESSESWHRSTIKIDIDLIAGLDK